MGVSEIVMWSAMKIGVYAIAGILAHWPSNWGIRKIIGRWKPEEDGSGENLGAFIGTLERMLTIILISTGSYTAIGFVVAMKSIARYERVQKEKKFAEYFLAGTMLSILIALLLGLAVGEVVEVLESDWGEPRG